MKGFYLFLLNHNLVVKGFVVLYCDSFVQEPDIHQIKYLDEHCTRATLGMFEHLCGVDKRTTR
jgi:hypothetical protein